jgi:hypothetical protein
MAYLTSDEIVTYTSIPGITMADVTIASGLIDAYKGRSFISKSYTETVKLKKKNRQYKGKLEHYPRISIDSIVAEVCSPFGGTVEQTYDSTCLSFDDDEFEYFTFVPQVSAQNIFPQIPPEYIKVTYKAGYEVIPEPLKIACGLICDNVKQNGGYRSFKSRQDFDMQVAFSEKEDPVMSSTVLRLINMVKLR